MFNIIYILSLTLLISCGVRKEDTEKEAPEVAFLGSWQHQFDLDKKDDCDPNLECSCMDVFNFYSSFSFDRNLKCEYTKGAYQVVNKKLRLVYVAQYPQVFDYSIHEKELIIVKGNIEHSYVRKPFKVKMSL